MYRIIITLKTYKHLYVCECLILFHYFIPILLICIDIYLYHLYVCIFVFKNQYDEGGKNIEQVTLFIEKCVIINLVKQHEMMEFSTQ